MSLLLSLPEAQAVIEADRLCNNAFNEFSDNTTLGVWTRLVGAAHERIKAFKPDQVPSDRGQPWPSTAWTETRRTTSWCCGSPVYEVQAKLVLEEGQLPSENYKHERRWVPVIVILCPCGHQMFGEEYVSPNGISSPTPKRNIGGRSTKKRSSSTRKISRGPKSPTTPKKPRRR